MIGAVATHYANVPEGICKSAVSFFSPSRIRVSMVERLTLSCSEICAGLMHA